MGARGASVEEREGGKVVEDVGPESVLNCIRVNARLGIGIHLRSLAFPPGNEGK